MMKKQSGLSYLLVGNEQDAKCVAFRLALIMTRHVNRCGYMRSEDAFRCSMENFYPRYRLLMIEWKRIVQMLRGQVLRRLFFFLGKRTPNKNERLHMGE